MTRPTLFWSTFCFSLCRNVEDCDTVRTVSASAIVVDRTRRGLIKTSPNFFFLYSHVLLDTTCSASPTVVMRFFLYSKIYSTTIRTCYSPRLGPSDVGPCGSGSSFQRRKFLVSVSSTVKWSSSFYAQIVALIEFVQV